MLFAITRVILTGVAGIVLGIYLGFYLFGKRRRIHTSLAHPFDSLSIKISRILNRQINLFKRNRASFKTNKIQSLESYKKSKEVSKSLQEKLLRMVDGNLEEAERLVARARFCSFGKSEAYYWWKAIRYLEKKRQDRPNI